MNVPIRHIEYSVDTNCYRIIRQDGTKTDWPGTAAGYRMGIEYHQEVAKALWVEQGAGTQPTIPFNAFKYYPVGRDYDQQPDYRTERSKSKAAGEA